MAQPLTFGIIGVGYFGKHYVRLLEESEGATLSLLTPPSALVAPELKKSYSNIQKKIASPKEIIEDPAIQCIVIATPARTHFKIAEAALQCGKHVLCEKPMTQTLQEAELLRTAVEKSGCIFMVGHQYLYNDHIRRLKEELNRNTFGKISHIIAEHFYFGPIRRDGGCMWETAVHEISMLDYFLNHAEPRFIDGRRISINGAREDYATFNLMFPDQMMATISVSWFYPQKVRRMAIIGEKGTAFYDDTLHERKLMFRLVPYPENISESSSFFTFQDQVSDAVPEINAREPLRNQLEHFIDCAVHGKRPLTDIEHGLRVIKLLDTISKEIRL